MHANRMRRFTQHDFEAENSPFVTLLNAFAKSRDLHRGIRLHCDLLKRGLLNKSPCVVDALVSMYAKCGAFAYAQALLDGLFIQNVITWTALITGYAQQGQAHDALTCFERMQCAGVSPDAVTFACILKVCGSIGAVDKGKQIHDAIAKQGLLQKDVVLGTALVDMYAKCGELAKAQQVLEELPNRDAISWNALIAGYAQQRLGQDALNCFERLKGEGLSPNVVTFTCILKACGGIGAIDKGEQIHDEIVRQGLLGKYIVLDTALVDMYAKCGALAKAQRMLEELPVRDVVSWSALIAGYAQYEHGGDALKCFERMQWEGFFPNAVTLSCILKACGSIGNSDKGEQIHNEIARRGWLGDNIMLGNALVDMYAKCGALAKAQRVLEELPARDVVSWSALIGGYAQQGQGNDALHCLEQMQGEGISPNAVTFACIFKACGSIGALEKGEKIHNEVARQELLENDNVLVSALVDMYAKCGALAKAQRVLETHSVADVASWSALIAGYARKGQGKEALSCFARMQQKDLSPDAITLSCVLTACSLSGLVDEGRLCFANMSTWFGIEPDVKLYTCMVDLFGHAGHLDNAAAVIKRMPASDDFAIWSSLLGSCRKSGDVNVGRWAFEHASLVEKSDDAPLVYG